MDADAKAKAAKAATRCIAESLRAANYTTLRSLASPAEMKNKEMRTIEMQLKSTPHIVTNAMFHFIYTKTSRTQIQKKTYTQLSEPILYLKLRTSN